MWGIRGSVQGFWSSQIILTLEKKLTPPESSQTDLYAKGFEYSLEKSEHDCAGVSTKETSENNRNLGNSLPACRMKKLVPL